MKTALVVLVALNAAQCVFLVILAFRISHLEDLLIGDAVEALRQEYANISPPFPHNN